jgi:hypothetical protein
MTRLLIFFSRLDCKGTRIVTAELPEARQYGSFQCEFFPLKSSRANKMQAVSPVVPGVNAVALMLLKVKFLPFSTAIGRHIYRTVA